MKKSHFKVRRVRSLAHLNRVRGMYCLVCGNPPRNHAHHITYSEKSGMGLKVGDQWTVPLCPICHHELHTCKYGEKLFWIQNGIDPIEKAKEYWHEYNT